MFEIFLLGEQMPVHPGHHLVAIIRIIALSCEFLKQPERRSKGGVGVHGGEDVGGVAEHSAHQKAPARVLRDGREKKVSVFHQETTTPGSSLATV